MTGTTHDLRAQLERGVAELRTLRDEIRVQIQLATMETRTRWEQIERRIDEIEDSVRELADDALTGTLEWLGNVTEAARRIRAELRRR